MSNIEYDSSIHVFTNSSLKTCTQELFKDISENIIDYKDRDCKGEYAQFRSHKIQNFPISIIICLDFIIWPKQDKKGKISSYFIKLPNNFVINDNCKIENTYYELGTLIGLPNLNHFTSLVYNSKFKELHLEGWWFHDGTKQKGT